MKKPDYGKVMKIAAGAGLAMILAERLGLNYSASAGVITLLSIQDTKKETIRVVVRRLLSWQWLFLRHAFPLLATDRQLSLSFC